MENTEKKYKIFSFVLPASGHCIPLYPILNELIQKHKNVEVIVYTTESRKKDFEKIGAKVKKLEYIESEHARVISEVNKKEIFIFEDLVKTLKIATDNLEQIIKDIDSEKPDLIYYDNTLPNKYINYIIDYYEKSYNGKGLKANKLNFRPTYKLPPMIAFSPAFVTEKDIYPNKTELSITLSIYSFLSLNVLWQIIAYLIAHYKFCDTFGFGFMNPLEILKLEPIPKTKFIIITVSPDIHPRSHLYNNKFFKFVGSTINHEEISRSSLDSIKDDKIKAILEYFDSKEKKENDKLVYVSLGTVFNHKISIFKSILDSFKTFDIEPDQSKSSVKFENLKIIVSMGEQIFYRFQDMIYKDEYILPKNILLVKTAPQVEILKRASLFVTHGGMNSTSESILCAGKEIKIFNF